MQLDGSSCRSRNLQHVGGGQKVADVLLVDLDAPGVGELYDELQGALANAVDAYALHLRFPQVAREHGVEVGAGRRQNNPVRRERAFA